MAHHVHAKVLLHPVAVVILGTLVDGKRDGSYESNARHRSSYTCGEEVSQLAHNHNGDKYGGTHLERTLSASRLNMYASRNPEILRTYKSACES